MHTDFVVVAVVAAVVISPWVVSTLFDVDNNVPLALVVWELTPLVVDIISVMVLEGKFKSRLMDFVSNPATAVACDISRFIASSRCFDWTCCVEVGKISGFSVIAPVACYQYQRQIL